MGEGRGIVVAVVVVVDVFLFVVDFSYREVRWQSVKESVKRTLR